MPIYEYECLTCGSRFDKRQSFSDQSIANCPNGHNETRRLLSAPAIVFKGSGFYVNDSKSSKNGLSGTSNKNQKTDSKSETKSESTSSKSKKVKAET